MALNPDNVAQFHELREQYLPLKYPPADAPALPPQEEKARMAEVERLETELNMLARQMVRDMPWSGNGNTMSATGPKGVLNAIFPESARPSFTARENGEMTQAYRVKGVAQLRKLQDIGVHIPDSDRSSGRY